MTILDDIFERKRERVAEVKHRVDMGHLRESAQRARYASALSLRSALSSKPGLNVIAEFKRASPSRGMINDRLDSVATARKYETGGARAISVLTEEDYFKGSLDDMRNIREAVSIPVLRKDFIFDEFQILEAAAAGADAVLLIVAYLQPELLSGLMRSAHDLGVDALVEVHTAEEMEIAKEVGASLIGVNNRNLRTFEVSLDVSRELVKFAPANAVLVAESGLRTRDDLVELHALGYSGFLIGDTLMRSDDRAGGLRDLIGTGELMQ
ncbi:MAG TPA: indole-3-glycerol phosphate synthase TrpC [Pyrinomonadaceae bacterium]|nr:indole-3-glycerol phosphate synthase TrpC [Pyrinomonadaceae bacterium]